MPSSERRIVLIACSSKKLSESARARDLYISPLFQLSFAYAEALNPDAIYILSAKHGFVRPDHILLPYDESLREMGATEMKKWAERVLMGLRLVADPWNNEFIILAGERYRRYLEPQLMNVQVPLKGLRIGQQLQFLKRALT